MPIVLVLESRPEKESGVAMNTSLRRGLYRIPGIQGLLEEYVQVEDASGNMPIPAWDYVARRYPPPLHELPWQDDYFEKKGKQS
jgi:hypothetical protein